MLHNHYQSGSSPRPAEPSYMTSAYIIITTEITWFDVNALGIIPTLRAVFSRYPPCAVQTVTQSVNSVALFRDLAFGPK